MPPLRRESGVLIRGRSRTAEARSQYVVIGGRFAGRSGARPLRHSLVCVCFGHLSWRRRPSRCRSFRPAWTPFTNEPGQPRFALDLVEAALGRTMRTAKTAIVPPAQFTTALLSGKFDGSAAAWKDAERERVLRLFPALSREPPGAGRPSRRGCVGEDARRSQGQARGDCRRLLVRRRGGQIRRHLRTGRQRRREPRTSAQARRRLHADGRSRR